MRAAPNALPASMRALGTMQGPELSPLGPGGGGPAPAFDPTGGGGIWAGDPQRPPPKMPPAGPETPPWNPGGPTVGKVGPVIGDPQMPGGPGGGGGVETPPYVPVLHPISGAPMNPQMKPLSPLMAGGTPATAPPGRGAGMGGARRRMNQMRQRRGY